MLVPCLAYSLTPKVDVTCSSETSVDFQPTIRRHVAGYRTLRYRGNFLGTIISSETPRKVTVTYQDDLFRAWAVTSDRVLFLFNMWTQESVYYCSHSTHLS
jgi:hypothetical protein